MAGMPIYCNVLWPSRDEALAAAKGDIRLAFCQACGIISNVAFDPGLVDYVPGYENSLHFSPHFQDYARDLSSRLTEKYALHGKHIVEVGCGNGDFLALLCGDDNRGTGFDPSYRGTALPPNVTIIQDYYSEAYVCEQADLIVCRQVLEHVAEPRGFLEQIRRGCPGAVFFEVPNALYTLRDLGIWDIIYEHPSYFTEPSLTRLFSEVGFSVSEVYPGFGGQYLCLEASPSSITTPEPSPAELTEIAALARGFAAHYHAKLDHWNNMLARHGDDRMAVWGAGSKGVTFLNTVQGGNVVDYVIDINPRKRGRYLPGTGQRVSAPEDVLEAPPSVVLVMNPNYQAEIRAMLDELGIAADLAIV
jgi:SAM-dependent methyltransferase